jgi:hypothetical protein
MNEIFFGNGQSSPNGALEVGAAPTRRDVEISFETEDHTLQASFTWENASEFPQLPVG